MLRSVDSAYDEAFIPYSVTAADNAGNPNTTYASQTSVIKFYESLPTVTPMTIAYHDQSSPDMGKARRHGAAELHDASGLERGSHGHHGGARHRDAKPGDSCPSCKPDGAQLHGRAT